MTLRILSLCFVCLLCACSAPARETARAPTTAPAESAGVAAPASTTSASPSSDTATFVAPDSHHTSDYDALLVQLDALDAVMLGTPDCARACAHLATICELAERVCTLARNASAREIEAECRVGRERCQSNTVRVAELCTCPKP